MILYQNLKSGETLTELELRDLNIKKWTQMFNDSENYRAYTFKNFGGTLNQWINYMDDCYKENKDFAVIQE